MQYLFTALHPVDLVGRSKVTVGCLRREFQQLQIVVWQNMSCVALAVIHPIDSRNKYYFFIESNSSAAVVCWTVFFFFFFKLGFM